MKKNNLPIIWEDDELVVVNKPAGLLCIPGRFDSEEMNLKSLLKKKYDDIYTVHRIDRDTSGLVCFAKNKEMHSALSQSFSNHLPEKKYLAISNGNFAKNEGNINFPLADHPQKKGKVIVHKNGKKSFTSYEVIEIFKSFTLVELRIKTGRTHQIRVHLEAIGNPIVADPFYSHSSSFFLSTLKRKQFQQSKSGIERPLLSRTALHAWKLSFEHPTTGEQLVFEAPLPKDMRATLTQLRKWDTKK